MLSSPSRCCQAILPVRVNDEEKDESRTESPLKGKGGEEKRREGRQGRSAVDVWMPMWDVETRPLRVEH